MICVTVTVALRLDICVTVTVAVRLDICVTVTVAVRLEICVTVTVAVRLDICVTATVAVRLDICVCILYVSLTVHLSITLANDQLAAQILIHLLQSSTCTCFVQYLAYPQEVRLYEYSIWYRHSTP